MRIPFTKYQGTGNDFIMINGFQDAGIMFKLNTRIIKQMCDRHVGIGADGLIILAPDASLDFQMIYYNSDGRASSMCGNGGRCIAHFAQFLGYAAENMTFKAIDGVHNARVAEDVTLGMKDVGAFEKLGDDYILDTGSPHYVRFVESLDSGDFKMDARAIRNSAKFEKDGINVNFVRTSSKGLEMRTYERGVEDETLSCGTGVVAASLAAYLQDSSLGLSVNVSTPGGELNVSFDFNGTVFRNIELCGPVSRVFEGVIEIGGNRC